MLDPCVVAHHWIVETRPTRGSYHATCKVCGQEREFPQVVTRLKYVRVRGRKTEGQWNEALR